MSGLDEFKNAAVRLRHESVCDISKSYGSASMPEICVIYLWSSVPQTDLYYKREVSGLVAFSKYI